MWFTQSIFYQFYPLGVCGAPWQNQGQQSHAIASLVDWIPHLQRLGINAVYFSPVFDSDAHGYDTRDYLRIDPRLGTNEDFAVLCRALHGQGIHVVLDGVFNHVGRGFWAFRDVQEKREASPYKDWFHIDFGGNSNYNDGFWYKGWEGHYELVELNLQNPAVVDYLLDCVGKWMDWFEIDGLRLDVAYTLEESFMARLHGFVKARRPDFFLLGEILHGDYNRLLRPGMLDSCTNYECYKGLYSSFNSMNLFEIAHSIARQSGPEPWALYRDKHLFTFADNHDVERLASILQNPAHIPLAYGLLFTMPGIPCIYYGSEWGAQGRKRDGDPALRPAFAAPEWNQLSEHIAWLSRLRQSSRALCYGDYRMLQLTNRQYVFQRSLDGERVQVAINADAQPFQARWDTGAAQGTDLRTGETVPLSGGAVLPPYSFSCWRV